MVLQNRFLVVLSAVLLIGTSCGNNNKGGTSGSETTTTETTTEPTATNNPKGVGKHTNVELTHPLDEKMVGEGKGIYEMKCASCHKLTGEKLVGPGWKGVTDRRTPEWIMNFTTNVDEMIEKDTAAQRMLEECLVRMPNQNLSDGDARSILEYMRKNDGKN